jgi:phosphatidate cytidylyltransferase
MSRYSGLQERVVTGVIGGALLILVVIFGGRAGVALLAAIISLGMLYEFIEISFSLPDKSEKRIALMGVAWLVAFVNFWIPRAEYELLLISFFGLFSYFLFTADRHKGPAFHAHFKELIYSIFGLFYLGFLPLFLILLRDYPNGVHWMLLFLITVWAGDTGAYYFGSRYGKRKLYPVISPKKTVEGAIGGIGSGFVIALIYKLLLFRSLSWGGATFIPVLIGAVSQVGDLCESFFKRAFDRKDSGSILPGHGGFLDRFDGVVFSLPIMYGCMRIFG